MREEERKKRGDIARETVTLLVLTHCSVMTSAQLPPPQMKMKKRKRRRRKKEEVEAHFFSICVSFWRSLSFRLPLFSSTSFSVQWLRPCLLWRVESESEKRLRKRNYKNEETETKLRVSPTAVNRTSCCQINHSKTMLSKV